MARSFPLPLKAGIREESDVIRRSSDRWSRGFLMFVFLGVLFLPWFLRVKGGSSLQDSAIYLLAALVMAGCWIGIGILLNRKADSLGFHPDSSRSWGSWKELLLYYAGLVPSAYFVIFWGASIFGTIAFNQVLVFIVISICVYIVPFWMVALTLVLELVLLNMGMQFFLGWKGLSLGSFLGIGSGMAFGCMMFVLLKREAASRIAMEALIGELDTANRKLTAFSQEVENLAAVQERNRIAREIHDTLGHSLTVVNVQLEAADALLAKGESIKALGFVGKAKEMNRKGLKDVRASVSSLRASPLDGRTLETSLCELVKQSDRRELKISFDVSGQEMPLDDSVALALYRTVQEGLTNVRKHAQASRVDIGLEFRNGDQVVVSIEDNGVGCDQIEGGFGILGVRERIQFLEGETMIKTSLGGGFLLEARVPV